MIQSFSTKKRTLPIKISFVTKWGKWWKILIITCTTLSTLSGAQLPQVSNIFPRSLCRIYLKCRKLWQITQGSFLRVDSSPTPPPSPQQFAGQIFTGNKLWWAWFVSLSKLSKLRTSPPLRHHPPSLYLCHN